MINAWERISPEAFEELHRFWFVFGTSAEPRLNLVDLNDGNDDVILNLKPEVAVEIIKLRDSYLNRLYKLLLENWNES
jgi:hypothetical protein